MTAPHDKMQRLFGDVLQAVVASRSTCPGMRLTSAIGSDRAGDAAVYPDILPGDVARACRR